VLSDSERRTMRALEADLLSDPAFARAVAPIVRSVRALAGPVVVGIAADGSSAGAVEWAAAEAAAQGCPLHLVHALRAPLVLDPMCAVPVAGVGTDRAAATAVLRRAFERIHLLVPGLDVTTQVVQGPAPIALRRESRDARLLVLGARPPRRPGRLPRPGRGAVRTRLTASAPCPVAVVHRSPDLGPVARHAGVLVGIDGTDRCDAALGFAFAAAQRRDLPVVAVHAWTADRPADLEAVTASPWATETTARAVVGAALDRWSARFPTVPVSAALVHRDPAGALIAGSADAALVVVGTRGLGRVRAALLGSVSRAVVDGVAGPVVVVRPGLRRRGTCG
jgi:nucleotide-binding universal stress UspA family protein